MASQDDASMSTSNSTLISFQSTELIDIDLLFVSTIFSHIFWIGDLNYRLVDNPPRQVFNTTNFDDVIKSDQLYQEMQRRRVFVNYSEGPINFRPTYKYDPGTDDWDSRYTVNGYLMSVCILNLSYIF